MKNTRNEWFQLLVFIAVICLMIWAGIAIATSDLPDWVKFFLLK